MSAIELTIKPHCQTAAGLIYQHVHIQITAPDGVIAPADLKELTMPTNLIWSQGIVLEGRAPVWLYGCLVHACHPATWIGCFDPRMGSGKAQTGGAVVVMTHLSAVAVGDVLAVEIPEECLG